MTRLFVLTPEAKQDLKEIFFDIAEDSPDTTKRLRLEFYEGLQALGRSPGIGHYHDELLFVRCGLRLAGDADSRDKRCS